MFIGEQEETNWSVDKDEGNVCGHITYLKLMKDVGDMSIYDSNTKGTKIRNRVKRRLEW